MGEKPQMEEVDSDVQIETKYAGRSAAKKSRHVELCTGQIWHRYQQNCRSGPNIDLIICPSLPSY